MNLKELYEASINQDWTHSGLDVRYKLIINGDTANLYFAYTWDSFGWKENFKFFPKEIVQAYKNTDLIWYAHEGFLDMYKSVKDEIKKQITVDIKHITISGFSQGASLSILAHEDLWYSFPNLRSEIRTYSFAPARVLYQPYPKLLERFINVKIYARHGDPVPHVPFWVMGFDHPVKKKMIGKPHIMWVSQHSLSGYESDLPSTEE